MKKILFVAYIICLFGVFDFTAFSFLANIYLAILSVIGIFVFFLRRLFVKHNILFVSIIVVVFLVVISIYKAKIIHDQSVFSGLIANISYLNCFAPFAFWNQIRNVRILDKRVWSALIVMIWINATYVTVFSIFNLSYDYISPFSDNVLVVNTGKVSKMFIMLGIIYYFISAINKKKPLCFFFAFLLFLTTQLYDIQRGIIVLIFIIFLLISFSYRKRVIIKKSLFILPIVAVFFFIFASNFEVIITAVEEKFEGVFELLAPENEYIEDSSVRIRVVETAYALHNFEIHPIFGNGNLRSSYQKEILPGLFFYPADIGIFGVLYLFGLFGIVIFILILFVLRRIYKEMDKKKTIEMTLYFFLISLVYTTLKDANIFIEPDAFFFLLLTLIFMIKKRSLQPFVANSNRR